MIENQRRWDWDVLLRRRPVRLGGGRAEGGWTDEFEIVCRECGDDPNLDYRQASPEHQRIRGPYPMAAGVAAFERHARPHPAPQASRQPAARCAMSRRPAPWEGGFTSQGPVEGPS